MKNRVKLNKPTKITLSVIAAVLVVLLTLTWVMFMIIQVHKTKSYGFSGEYERTRTIAHRGYSGKYHDNTVQSFTAAGEESFFDGIETDIRLTADGVWVCSHDDNPFVDKSVYITKSKYADIKDLPLDIVNHGHDTADKTVDYRIATYEEYLGICLKYNKIALIEIKGKYDVEALTAPVSAAMDKLGYNRAYFGSFTLASIENVLKIRSYARVLTFAGQSIVAYCYQKMGYSVGVNKKILTDKLIERSKNNDKATFVYTIKNKDEYAFYREKKVDYIITDYAY